MSDGVEALSALKLRHYDLVLMDVQMPQLDGLETTRGIRSGLRGIDRSIPIIAMTAHAMIGDRETCLVAGMNAYVSKPVVLDELVEALDQWLPTERDGATSETDSKARAAARATTDGATGQPERAEAHSDSDPQIWDRTGLLDRLIGDVRIMQAVTVGFLDDMSRRLDALDFSVADDNWADVIRHAHTIKGAAGNVSGGALQHAAERLESAAREGNFLAARGGAVDVRREYLRLKAEMIADRNIS